MPVVNISENIDYVFNTVYQEEHITLVAIIVITIQMPYL